MEKRIENLEELEREAKELVDRLIPGEHATLITLSGELGAGKTTFTQALARAFGVRDTVTSPTFVLEKIYALPAEAKFEHFVHIDAYRLNAGEELRALGFQKLFEEPGNLIVLEWPERVADALPPALALTLVANSDGSRTFSHA